MEKKTPRLSISPYFDQGLVMVQALLVTAVGSLLLTVLGGVFLYLLLSLIGLGRFVALGYVFGLVFVASVVTLPPLFFEIRKKSCQRTVFNFYEDHVDFQFFQFYISQRRGRLRYRDIEDVYQRASTLQEQRGLTTVYLYAPSMRVQGGFPGLKIADVPQSRDYMTAVMNLVDAGNRGAVSFPIPPQPVAAAGGSGE